MTETTINPSEAPNILMQAWVKHLGSGSQESTMPHPYVYASSRRRCLRQMFYESSMPAARPAWEAETLARFRRGKDRERDLVQDLARCGRLADPGFEVVSQQESVELKDRKGRIVIKGRTDGRIAWSRTFRQPFEVKAWSPYLVDSIHDFTDVLRNKWTWSGGFQLLSYLYQTGEPNGLLILDRSGLPKIIPVNLENHLHDMEQFLQDAEVVVDAFLAKTPPAYTDDSKECRRCWAYGALCNPPLKSEGASVDLDPEVAQKLARHDELEGAAEEYGDLDKELKEHFRGIEKSICGEYLVSGRWSSNTLYEVPKDIKMQYRKVVERGKFALTFQKLGTEQ